MRTSHKINSIQALRALAVFLVVYIHILMDNSGSLQSHFFYLTSWGALGVDLFFIISGFIMTSLLPRYINENIPVSDFLKKRLIRILPLYWLISSTVLYLSRNANWITAEIKIKTFTIFPVFDKDTFIFPLVPQGWTLAYELYFYLIISLLLLFLKRSVVSTLIIVIILFSIIGCFVDSTYLINFLVSPLLLEFCMGILICLIYQYIKANPLQINRFKAPAIISLIVGLGLMFITLFTGVNGYNMAEIIAKDNHLALLRALFWGIPCALFLYGFVSAELVFNFKIPKIFIIIGDASYSCYLIHFILERKINSILRSYFTLNVDLGILINITIVIFVSILFYKYIERPLIKLFSFLN